LFIVFQKYRCYNGSVFQKSGGVPGFATWVLATVPEKGEGYFIQIKREERI